MSRSLDVPGATLGVVGGGQLGRMLAEAAAPLGVEVVVLDPTPDCPAATVAADQVVGDFDDAGAVHDLAARADALTVEIELADPDLLAAAGERAGVPVHPSPATLRTVKDKLVQKRHLADRGVPVPRFRPVGDAADLRAACEELGYPAMLKARTGGYDGRGNRPVESPDDAEAAVAEIAGPAMVEEFVDFERELSVVGVRGADGTVTFPAAENVHEAEILRASVVPARAPDAVRERAQAVARDVLAAMDGRGTVAVELFERPDGGILVNEIAPRPHNSGHWSIEAAATSQFEQHARAVAGRPLGATDLRGPAVTVNLLGDVDRPRPVASESAGDSEGETDAVALRGVDDVLSDPAAHLHWYGKREVRPLRKMGHVTLTGVDGDVADSEVVADDGTGVDDGMGVETLLARGRTLRDGLTFEPV